MRAYVLHGIDDLRYEEVAVPKPGKNAVLVAVKAAGICGSDIPRIYRTGTYSYPLIPGHEFAGEVVELGENVDKDWLGKRVGVFPLIPCKECPQCIKKQYEMCTNYNYLGSRTDGGFAEYVEVPIWNLIELPDKVKYEQAAMLEPTAVAMHAIRKIGVKAEESVAVCGMGTIGLLTVMLLQNIGCKNIFVIGNKDRQKSMVLKLGIAEENFCDMRKEAMEKWLLRVTGGRGVDVFFDCVGRNEVLTGGIQSVVAGGRVMLVGNPASDMMFEKAVYWKILRKQLTLKGTWNSSFTHEISDDWNSVLREMQAGRLCPEKLITHGFALEELRKGMEIMRDKAEEYIKVMGYVE